MKSEGDEEQLADEQINLDNREQCNPESNSQKHKNEVGRPTKYCKELNEQVYKLCLLGAVDTEIADFFGICERTLNYWKENHESFYESMKSGKSLADANVVERLYKRATGYEYTEETEELAQHPDLTDVFVVKYKKRVKKEMPPDTGACMAWLKNRRPDKWRETKAVDINVNPKLEDFL
jgi:hypothetical protein